MPAGQATSVCAPGSASAEAVLGLRPPPTAPSGRLKRFQPKQPREGAQLGAVVAIGQAEVMFQPGAHRAVSTSGAGRSSRTTPQVPLKLRGSCSISPPPITSR